MYLKVTYRIDKNLKTRIELLAIKNKISFNKMFNYILELGYGTYIERYEKYYEEQNKEIRKEVDDYK